MNKYEIYLPLKYNNGSEIEPEKFKQIREQLMAVFGAITVSSLSAPFQGSTFTRSEPQKGADSTNNYLAARPVDFRFVPFVPFCGLLFFVAFRGPNQRVVSGGRSMAEPETDTPSWPP